MNCLCGHPERAHMGGGRVMSPIAPASGLSRATRYLVQTTAWRDALMAIRGPVK